MVDATDSWKRTQHHRQQNPEAGDQVVGGSDGDFEVEQVDAEGFAHFDGDECAY